MLLVDNGVNWSIKGFDRLWHDGSVCRWMMWAVAEPRPHLFVHTRIYVEYQMERAGDRCTLTLLYIHGGSCRLLEACCPTGRPVGWDRKDTQSFFESWAEIKLLEARKVGEKSTSFREESALLCTVHWCTAFWGVRDGTRGLLFWLLQIEDPFKSLSTVQKVIFALFDRNSSKATIPYYIGSVCDNMVCGLEVEWEMEIDLTLTFRHSTVNQH